MGTKQPAVNCRSASGEMLPDRGEALTALTAGPLGASSGFTDPFNHSAPARLRVPKGLAEGWLSDSSLLKTTQDCPRRLSLNA